MVFNFNFALVSSYHISWHKSFICCFNIWSSHFNYFINCFLITSVNTVVQGNHWKHIIAVVELSTADGRKHWTLLLVLCDVVYPQRKTWWWRWSSKLWMVSSSRAIISRTSSRSRLFILVHLHRYMVHHLTSRGENHRKSGQGELSNFHLLLLFRNVSSFMCLTFVFTSVAHTELTELWARTNQVTKWCTTFFILCV